MKERKISKYFTDDWWFREKTKFNSRYEWWVNKEHVKRGATYNPNFKETPNLRSRKGEGGSTDMPHPPSERKKNKIRTRFNIEDLFIFDYNEMMQQEPNMKFNILYNLKFNHTFDDENKQAEYDENIEIYNELKESGEIEKVNNIYRKLSTYIKKNKLNRKYVDGSIICNIALMVAEYMRSGVIRTDMDFLSNIKYYNADRMNRFHLFLILQCFVSKNQYFKQYISDVYIRDWWAICHLHHRWSDKDMKTKGQCSGFKNTNGKYIYKPY